MLAQTLQLYVSWVYSTYLFKRCVTLSSFSTGIDSTVLLRRSTARLQRGLRCLTTKPTLKICELFYHVSSPSIIRNVLLEGLRQLNNFVQNFGYPLRSKETEVTVCIWWFFTTTFHFSTKLRYLENCTKHSTRIHPSMNLNHFKPPLRTHAPLSHIHTPGPIHSQTSAHRRALTIDLVLLLFIDAAKHGVFQVTVPWWTHNVIWRFSSPFTRLHTVLKSKESWTWRAGWHIVRCRSVVEHFTQK